MEGEAWRDSLWMNCFFEVYEENRKAGKAHVNFSEVDQRVIEKSKVITKYQINLESG